MMKNDICGIYLITNKINGHMYVGQSIHIYQRWREHCALKDLDSSFVEKAIAKYGEENFSFDIIITLENDTDKLNDAEREWIAILNTYEDKNHYNQTPGGSAALYGENNPAKLPEVRAKMSKAKSGKNHPMYGKKHTQETRAKISKAQSGENNSMYDKKHTPEAKEKMSKARNTTGYFRVSKRKCNSCKQNFNYCYQYYDDCGKQRSISSVDLEKLEQKVKAKGLEWFKLDDDDDNIFKIQESNKILYTITHIASTGQLYNNYKTLDLDIHQILKTKHRVLDKEITVAEAKKIATNIGISYDILQKVAYNLNKSVFNKYIDEWQARLANTL